MSERIIDLVIVEKANFNIRKPIWKNIQKIMKEEKAEVVNIVANWGHHDGRDCAEHYLLTARQGQVPDIVIEPGGLNPKFVNTNSYFQSSKQKRKV